MRKTVFALTASAAFALAGCSQHAQNETAEAGEAVAADANATAQAATNDVDAAADAALGSAEQSIDGAGRAVANGSARAADATGNAMIDAGHALKNSH